MELVSKEPALGAAFGDLQIEPAAVGVHAPLFEMLDPFGRQFSEAPRYEAPSRLHTLLHTLWRGIWRDLMKLDGMLYS